MWLGLRWRCDPTSSDPPDTGLAPGLQHDPKSIGEVLRWLDVTLRESRYHRQRPQNNRLFRETLEPISGWLLTSASF